MFESRWSFTSRTKTGGTTSQQSVKRKDIQLHDVFIFLETLALFFRFISLQTDNIHECGVGDGALICQISAVGVTFLDMSATIKLKCQTCAVTRRWGAAWRFREATSKSGAIIGWILWLQDLQRSMWKTSEARQISVFIKLFSLELLLLLSHYGTDMKHVPCGSKWFSQKKATLF